MNFAKHLELEGKHAFLSPSQYSWLNYDEEKVKDAYLKSLAKQRGTELHEYAASCIEKGFTLDVGKAPNKTLALYVNNCIEDRMSPEVKLVYSDNCFGTADAISFDENTNILKIKDLKTGITPAKMEQLMIYAALFCLEYHYKPADIRFELEIYQSEQVIYHSPESKEIALIMRKIKSHDRVLNKLRKAWK